MFNFVRKINSSSYVINVTSSLIQTLSNHAIFYPTPINFTYAYSFGSLVGLFFAIQILTGIFLAMHYTCGIENAFSSVVYIMNDVKNGFMVRYMHANGASMIFILMYLHIGRGLYYRSYLFNRRALWWSGIVIFLLMMGTAFIGYVLPWGQMSFWGATVITSLVTAVPLVGESVANWVWGGFSVSNPTLVRFFSIHYLLPFIITGLIGLHLVLLHEVTSTNPMQVTPGTSKLPFHPYFTMKDVAALTFALMSFILLIKFFPNLLGHSDNFIPANPLVTPAHIVPEWYFTPFYAILRAYPDKLGGVISMVCAILVLALLPFFNVPQNNLVTPLSILQQLTFWSFCSLFLILLILGGKPATAPYVLASQLFTVSYFAYFLSMIPTITSFETLLVTPIIYFKKIILNTNQTLPKSKGSAYSTSTNSTKTNTPKAKVGWGIEDDIAATPYEAKLFKLYNYKPKDLTKLSLEDRNELYWIKIKEEQLCDQYSNNWGIFHLFLYNVILWGYWYVVYNIGSDLYFGVYKNYWHMEVRGDHPLLNYIVTHSLNYTTILGAYLVLSAIAHFIILRKVYYIIRNLAKDEPTAHTAALLGSALIGSVLSFTLVWGFYHLHFSYNPDTTIVWQNEFLRLVSDPFIYQKHLYLDQWMAELFGEKAYRPEVLAAAKSAIKSHYWDWVQVDIWDTDSAVAKVKYQNEMREILNTADATVKPPQPAYVPTKRKFFWL